jgi:pyruvate ferredoxin oxidoreductase beta subunit
MNTGIQRSSETPFGANTTTSPAGTKSKGQSTCKKNMAAIAAAHNVPYVATGSPAYHLDLMNKMRRAAAIEGPAYIHVFAPCPTGWRMKPELSVESAKLVVTTRIFPIYEVLDGEYVLNRKIDNPTPIEDYLKIQGRFKHLKPADVDYIREKVNHEYDRIVRLAEAFPVTPSKA